MALLPGVKPWVQFAADEVDNKFHPTSQLGVGLRSDNPSSDHPKGLAVDNMVGSDRAKGDAIATYAVANASRLGITYVIWYARIWEPGKGWQPYTHPSGGTSPTQLHMDHVHISFLANFTTGGTSAPIDTVQGFGVPGLSDAKAVIDAAGKAVHFLTDPHSYVRAAMLVGGIILLIYGLLTIDNVKSAANTVVKGAKTVAQS
jgi:hypothetical protein